MVLAIGCEEGVEDKRCPNGLSVAKTVAAPLKASVASWQWLPQPLQPSLMLIALFSALQSALR